MFPECRAALDAVFLCRIGQRRVVVFGEYLNVFVEFSSGFVVFYEIFWNLCVFLGEKRFIMGFYARSFGVLPGYARGIFSSIGK